MASKLLGRTRCPLCDDDKAHVKIKTDKAEGSTAYPYIHCRECNWQGHTKGQHQAELLLKKTRPENIPAPEKAPEPIPATPEKSNEIGQHEAQAATARTSRFGFGGLL